MLTITRTKSRMTTLTMSMLIIITTRHTDIPAMTIPIRITPSTIRA